MTSEPCPNTHTESTPSASPSLSEHLSFPTPTEHEFEQSPIASQQPRQLLKDRLYIGNLHPTVDEYSLLQIFSKFGKVTKLDFLFHKSGVMKGKPRGYAFVEYGNNDEALKALNMAHDKLLRGRKLVVTFAHQAPIEQAGSASSAYGALGVKRKGMMETGRPTTLSILKTGVTGRNDGAKIAMMEAKLRQMESTKPKASINPPKPFDSQPTSSLIATNHHPSLPMKPPSVIPSGFHTTLPQPPSKRPTSKSNQTLPSLPILQQPSSQITSCPLISENKTLPKQSKGSKISGIKIGKAKERQVAPETG